MLLLRRFEEKAAQMYGLGLIGGFCHLYIGQEAVVTGARAATNPDDYTITSYRCHAHAIACGIEPKAVMAELTGREGGISKGKGGSMHMFDPEAAFFGGHGIVGAQVSLGTGLAFASKYRGDGKVCMTYIGDGAMNQGQVYESFNMARLWNLPIIYIVENNKYGMGTSVQRASGNAELWKRGESFGIPGKLIDGMDYMAVRDAIADAADYARMGKGPMLLEMETYRYRGHSMSDPAKYRSKEEVENMRETRDPITRMASYLDSMYGVGEDAFKEIDRKVKKVVGDAASFAEASPQPGDAELYTDIMPE
ncbi:MAG: pyruvate dehydrogenase (acetyl-transferring) E1 component subunit alpha [Proteobacteria bacterium]|nr:pyruvate dehydrogenase (acetyl-transferring) E1 component subunit alpha [Pseudomonadota bacterium]